MTTPQSCDLVLSLGTNCEIAYNIRKHYGIERAGLLDWAITPLSAVLWLIENDFRIIGHDFGDELARVPVDGGESILHLPTGILFHHAFSRDSKDAIVETWRQEIPAVAEKHAFLAERMRGLLAEARRPLLFVNRAGLHGALAEDIRARSEDHAIYRRLVDAFAARYPHSSPTFALMNPLAAPLRAVQGDPRAVAIEVQHHGDWHEGIEGHFAGCATGWNAALSSLGFLLESPKRPAA